MLSFKGGILRYFFLIISLAILLAVGKFLLALDSIIDLIHFACVPFLATYLLAFRPNQPKNITSYCVYISVLVLIIATYFITFSITIPDVRINWLEPAIALYFLLSVYVLLWLLDKFINLVNYAIFERTLKNKTAFAVTKATLRLAVLIFIVTPYLVALFITHWVKFSDVENPEGLQDMEYSQVSFSAKDGAELKGWFIYSDNRISDSTIIIVPGKSAAKNLFLSYAKIFSQSNYNVLLFDLRGNGGSSGHKYSFAVNEVNDVLGAVDYVRDNRPESSNYIFGYGINEGASALIGAAAVDERFAAVVSDNACGYEIALPGWLAGHLPGWMEKSLLNMTKTFVHIDVGRDIWGAKGMHQKISQISPSPVLVANSIRNNKSSRMKAIELFTNAREPKRLWLAPTEEDHDTYSQYFINIIETFDTGKSKQQSGRWRISRSP